MRVKRAGAEPTVPHKVDFGTSFGMTPDEVRRTHRALMKGVTIRA